MAELPDAFGALEPYVGRWALATTAERHRARAAASMEELREFYEVAVAHADAAFAHLDRWPLDDLAPPDRRLLDLYLSLAGVALSVEKYGAPEVSPDAFRFSVDTAALG